jgi:hypothetical protein
MTNDDVITLGLHSFRNLYGEFQGTILNIPGATSVVCGAGITDDDGHLLTPFFLDPRQDHECAGSDLITLVLLTAIIHCISWSARWLFYEPFSNWFMKGHKGWGKGISQKLSATCTSALFFTISGCVGWKILRHKHWLFVRPSWTDNITIDGPLLIEADFKFYYLLYAARFTSDIISIFYEQRTREAFITTLIHHLTTLVLVLLSAQVGYTRFGGVIMFFFDWADIPLLSAKLCKDLSKDPTDIFQYTANRLFEFFAIVFFATRNVLYSYVVYVAVWDLPTNYEGHISRILLIILVVLQTYWMKVIIQAAIRQAKTGAIEDVREDDEDGTSTSTNAKKVN